jgi:hypothetical protein
MSPYTLIVTIWLSGWGVAVGTHRSLLVQGKAFGYTPGYGWRLYWVRSEPVMGNCSWKSIVIAFPNRVLRLWKGEVVAVARSESWCYIWWYLSRLETRTKESNSYASMLAVNQHAKWKWPEWTCLTACATLADLELRRQVWVWAYRLGPERWWTMPE